MFHAPTNLIQKISYPCWFPSTLVPVKLNDCSLIHSIVFASAVRILLEEGRGNYRNIFKTGTADCGKTFILSPITKIFPGTWVSPSLTKYALIDADEAEIIF